MSSSEEHRDRHAVPRLRSFAAAVQMGELSSIGPAPDDHPFTDDMLQGALADWESSPGISVAADLVSNAVTLGKEHLARDAAKFLMSQPNVPPAARRLAALCLGEGNAVEIAPGVEAVHSEAFELEPRELYDQIHR